MPFKGKSISVLMESIFTRPVMKTADIGVQHEILQETAILIDRGKIKSTATERLGKISAETIRRAHVLLETGTAHGKVVVEGY